MSFLSSTLKQYSSSKYSKIRRLCPVPESSGQSEMSEKVFPRPSSPIVVSVNSKDEDRKDLKKPGYLVFKASTSRKLSNILQKTLLIALCVIFVRIFLQLFGGYLKMKIPDSESNFELTTTGSRADWNDEMPEFCKRLIAHPNPQLRACKRDPKTFNCLDSGELIMFSQFKQDYYFYTQHFSKLKRPGIYLDVAANDPHHYSNSFFMDRCLGWKGICVEGNPVYHEKLYRERSCHLVPTCVGSREGQHVMFALGGGSSGVVGETFKNAERFAEQNKTLATIREKCTTMKAVLSRNNIFKADFLSLDVEGHELEVLKGFNWDKVKINVVSIETSPATLEAIESFMLEQGYKRHIPQLNERSIRSGLIHEDAVFLHEDVIFGSPV